MDNIENNKNVKKDKNKKSKNRNTNKSSINNMLNSINYINDIAKSIINIDYMSNIINNIIPKNYINAVSESILSQNYMSNLIDSILPKSYMNTISEIFNKSTIIVLKNIIPQNYISNMFETITNNISNICYTDTITNCINEIINSKINLNTILTNKEMINNTSVDIEKFNKDDKKNTLTNVKEIISISQKDNAEKLIYNKLNEIKKEHPLVAEAIFQIFWIIVSLVIGVFFTQNSNNYYIQNYTINNNFNIEKDAHLDFINNARYVTAQKLNVRNGPSKDYKVIDTLKYGDVIKVKSKMKYWTEILYNDIDNDIFIEGWVYSRYLEKFDIELLNEEI